jgi:hypothetical protein
MQDSFPLCAVPYQDSGEDMKLRDDDKKWISDEIAAQLRKGIAEAVAEFRPRGYRRVTHFLREWGLAGTLVTVPLGLLAICVTLGIFATSGIKDNTQFRTRTEDRLNAIEKDVTSIKQTLSDFVREATITRINQAGALTPKQLSEL